METRLEKELAHTIIELQVTKRNLKGVIAVMENFNIDDLEATTWHDIVNNIDHEEIIKRLSQNKKMQENLMKALKEHGKLKNLVIFGQAFDLVDKKAIIEASKQAMIYNTTEAGRDLLFAGKALHKIMAEESLSWIKTAKLISLNNGDADTFFAAIDFLGQAMQRRDIINLLEKNLITLLDQEREKITGKLVIPECKKCLNILRHLPEGEGEKMRKLIFE